MMSKKPIALLAVAAALVAISAAKAGTVGHRPLTIANGRADGYPCPLTSPSPGASAKPTPVAGISGKIVEIPGSSQNAGPAQFYSNVTCGTTAYLYRGIPKATPLVTKLKLVRGATAERAYDVDAQGETVGAMFFPKGVVLPYRWNAEGTPSALPTHTFAAATALSKAGGLPIVGEALNPQGVYQGFWFEPTPTFFIKPETASTINDVVPIPGVANTGVYVGEADGLAAAGIGEKGLAPLRIGRPSEAFAINDSEYIVGHFELAGACGALVRGAGFGIQYPTGAPVEIPPLDGDCDSSMLDVSDAHGAVGFSTRGIAGTQRAEGFNVPNLGKGIVDLNATTAFGPARGAPPWTQLGHRLIAATGIDAQGDIAATDSAGVVWFLEQ